MSQSQTPPQPLLVSIPSSGSLAVNNSAQPQPGSASPLLGPQRKRPVLIVQTKKSHAPSPVTGVQTEIESVYEPQPQSASSRFDLFSETLAPNVYGPFAVTPSTYFLFFATAANGVLVSARHSEPSRWRNSGSCNGAEKRSLS